MVAKRFGVFVLFAFASLLLISLVSASFFSDIFNKGLTGNAVNDGGVTGNAISDFFNNLFGTSDSTQSASISALDSTAVRDLPSSYTVGSAFNVAINLSGLAVDDCGITVEEYVPLDASVSSINNGGAYSAGAGRIAWVLDGPSCGGNAEFILSYNINFPVGGVRTFNGVTGIGKGPPTFAFRNIEITGEISVSDVNPVNGVCGATLNSCTTGVFTDITDSQSQYLWQCTGANGGSTASCSSNKPTFTLSTSVSGSGSITGTGISCGTGTANDCSEVIVNGTSTTLTATPASGYSFSGWTGCDSSSGSQCTVNMLSAKSVSATFTANPVNGVCGATLNSCTTGVFTDITDSQSQYLWQCTGANGGSTASCSSNKPTFTLSTSVNGQGSVSGTGISCGTGTANDCSEVIVNGTSTTLTATPASGYSFSGWTGCDSSSGSQCTVNMLSAKSVSATFTANPVNGVCGATLNSCTTGVFTDITDSQSQYLWQCTGANGGSTASCSSNKPTFTLSTSVNGQGSVSGTGISCGVGTANDCSETVVNGTPVTLTATPASGYSFSGWTGCDSSSSNQCTVNMLSAKSVSATFTANPVNGVCGATIDACNTGVFNDLTDSASQYLWQCTGANGGSTASCSSNKPTFTLSTSVNGQGSVSGTGISCGTGTANDCSEVIVNGTSTTLTATPASGYSFSGWTGCDSSSGSQCTVNMLSAKSVSATFTANPVNGVCGATLNSCTTGVFNDLTDSQTQYLWQCNGLNGGSNIQCSQNKPTFTLSTSVNGQGSVSGTGISCGVGTANDCSETVVNGTPVTLTATPASGYSFSGWTGCDSSSSNQCTVNMLSAKSVSATFTANPVNGVCGATLNSCTTGVFTDITDSQSQYLWQCTGANGGSTASCSSNKPTFTLSTSVSGSGSITGTGISCGTGTANDCSEVIVNGTSTTLTATPASGYSFSGWTGCDSSSGSQCTVNMLSAKSVSATFTAPTLPFDYTISAPNVAVTQGSSASQTISITKTQGTAQSVTATVGSLPSGITLTSANSQSCIPSAGTCSLTFSYSASASATVTSNSVVVVSTSSGVASKSNTFTLTVNLAGTTPSAPSNLAATTFSSSQINLAWTDTSNNENNFVVELSTNGINFATLTTLSANAVSYSNSGLSPGTLYYYRIKATNSVGSSTYSNIASATTLSNQQQTPATPTGLVAKSIAPTEVDLAWQDNANNEDGFIISRTSNLKRDPYVEIARIGPAAGANPLVPVLYNNSNINPGTTYYYKVRSYNTFGESSDSLFASIKTQPCRWWRRMFGLSC